MTFIGAIMTIGPVTGEHSQNKLAFRPIDQEVNQKDVVATGSVIDFFFEKKEGNYLQNTLDELYHTKMQHSMEVRRRGV